jgi:hypothetical protein
MGASGVDDKEGISASIITGVRHTFPASILALRENISFDQAIVINSYLRRKKLTSGSSY